MTPAQKLLKDPTKFIHENIIVVFGESIWNPDQKHYDSKNRIRIALVDYSDAFKSFSKRKKSSYFGLRRTVQNVAVGTYYATIADQSTPQEEVFLAYVCPVEFNKGSRAFLGTDADIMITAEMTGCTFGVGSMNPKTGTRMVMHANAKDAGSDDSTDLTAIAKQSAIQDGQIMNALGGSIDGMWRPNQYKNGKGMADYSSTVIGIRTSKPPAWNVYAQTINGRGSDTMEMVSVTKIA